ncbi:MAG: lysophospholipid acyltransferase family protein [Maricaulaceae bacterium]
MTALRSFAFVVWMYGLMALYGTIGAPVLAFNRNIVRKAYKSFVYLMLGGLRVLCGVTYRVEGLEHVPQGPILVAMKHQSMFDTMIVSLLFQDPVVVMKKSLAKLPFFGWYALRLGNIPVDRDAHMQALKALVRTAKARTEAGLQVVIFPEGTRSEPGERIAYKPGVAAIYKALDLPCVPVAHNSGLCWPPQGLVRRPGEIVIRVLPPVPAGLNRKTFMAEIEERIETASAELLPAPLHARALGPSGAFAPCVEPGDQRV